METSFLSNTLIVNLASRGEGSERIETWRADVPSLGELSPFHATYGYYAQGVGEETAVLPKGWKDRLVVVQSANTRGAKGLCLEVHDLLIAKVIAGREKDVQFLNDAARHHLADHAILLQRLEQVTADTAVKAEARRLIDAAFSVSGG